MLRFSCLAASSRLAGSNKQRSVPGCLAIRKWGRQAVIAPHISIAVVQQSLSLVARSVCLLCVLAIDL